MPTLFTKIINGDLPARFVWTDERVVAFLTIAPITAGHTPVVPRGEGGDWAAPQPDLPRHLIVVSGKNGAAGRGGFDAPPARPVAGGARGPPGPPHRVPPL